MKYIEHTERSIFIANIKQVHIVTYIEHTERSIFIANIKQVHIVKYIEHTERSIFIAISSSYNEVYRAHGEIYPYSYISSKFI